MTLLVVLSLLSDICARALFYYKYATPGTPVYTHVLNIQRFGVFTLSLWLMAPSV
jgi:hypothetical protein